MTEQCFKCKRYTKWPLTGETKDKEGRVCWRVTMCEECHDAWAASFEEVKA